MIYAVTDACIGCGFCRTACLAGAISMGANGYMEIDPNRCFQCGSCLIGCPMDAITAH